MTASKGIRLTRPRKSAVPDAVFAQLPEPVRAYLKNRRDRGVPAEGYRLPCDDAIEAEAVRSWRKTRGAAR